ncbi:putative membrane protein YesL [Natronobacillus azotifigens]|uniref:DUF624 domain-containing protein n=1 Tax=Natronobacillus azotifigens TaxID=472978 RepID=A0A9J6RF01_9BACI|nr:DUF624 domain-containing protein [Natronobacillus azotifigens]MCZ0704338.1 DUF624 domain-containing protein [Natronobacillus azotifigens]
MKPNGSLGKVYGGIEFIYQLLYLNILWFSFMVIGLGLFGIGPSTIALYATIRKTLMNKMGDDRFTFTFYFRTYKENFVRGNVLAIFIMLFGYILLVNYRYASIQPELIFQIISGATIVIAVLACIIISYIFPLYVHYELRMYEYVTKAITLMMGNLVPTLLNAFWIVIIGYLSYRLYPFSLLLAVSGLAYGIMGITYSFFTMNDRMVEEERKNKTS